MPFSFVMFIFGSLRSQSLSEYYKLQAQVLYTCCWFTVCYIFLPLAALALTLRVLYAAGTSLTYLPLVFCLLYFSSARCARTHSESVVRCRHESYILGVGFLFAVLYFSTARCARTPSESIVGCRHESYILADGILFTIFFFGSLRSHSL